MNAVFLEANDDPITKAVHDARRKALTSMPCYPERDLFGRDAYYSDVQKAKAAAGTIGLFSGMGHGGPAEFTGQWSSPIYDLQDSKRVNYAVVGAIVHLYSCDCAQNLGPYLVRLGAKAFVGYLNPVIVPNVQSVVDDFVRVAAVIDRSILYGDPHATAKRKADAESNVVETRLRASAAATPRDLASFRMNHSSMVGPWSNSRYGVY
jgi:hypothetical protein